MPHHRPPFGGNQRPSRRGCLVAMSRLQLSGTRRCIAQGRRSARNGHCPGGRAWPSLVLGPDESQPAGVVRGLCGSDTNGSMGIWDWLRELP